MFPQHPSSTLRARRAAALALTAVALSSLVACGDDADASPASGATASFVGLEDRAHVAGPLTISMEASGVEIAPAGEVVAGSGHFHVITSGGCAEPGTAIGKDATRLHFGDGRTGAELALPAGSYDLCLQVGDGQHVATDITDTVSVTIGVSTLDEWCSVAAEIDEITADVDLETSELADVQAAYTAAQAYADQLTEGLDVVEASRRDGIGLLLDYLAEFSQAVVDAPDAATARTAGDELMANVPTGVEAGFDDIAAVCDLPGA